MHGGPWVNASVTKPTHNIFLFFSCTVVACYDGWVATFYMYLECSPVPFTLFLPVFLCAWLFSSSLVPRPHSEMEKGPGHTCKNSCMYCVSTLFGVEESCSPITFLTREGSRLIPRPKWNLHIRPGLMHHVICAAGHIFTSADNNFCYVTLEVETSQVCTIDYGRKLAYKEPLVWPRNRFNLTKVYRHLFTSISS